MRLSILMVLVLAGCSSIGQKIERPFLYEVSKGSSKAYLFGTVHANISADELPTGFWPYFDQADVVGTELDLKATNAVYERSFRVGHKNVREVVTPVEYDAIVQYITHKYGDEHGAKILARETPNEIADRLSRIRAWNDHPTDWMEISFYGDSKLDKELRERAVSQGKTTTYLDSASQAAKAWMCADLTDDEAAKEIRQILIGDDVIYRRNQDFRKILTAYRNGDADSMRAIDERVDPSDSRDSNRSHDCLLKDRNELWAPKIESLMRAYSHPFIAMGAAHLFTSHDSLIDLLRDRGYTVERVELASSPARRRR